MDCVQHSRIPEYEFSSASESIIKNVEEGDKWDKLALLAVSENQ